jgi:endonuclease YncB( thermonuclease family)
MPTPAPAWASTAAAWAVLTLFAAGDAGAECAYPPPPAGLPTATVIGDIDGGSIRVRLGRRTETIRYLGVVVLPHGVTRDDAPGDGALDRRGTETETVALEFDDPARHPGEPRQAYVYAGDVMVNAELLCRGHARAATDLPPHRHHALFQRLEREAREAGRGRWPRVTVEDGSVSVVFDATPGDEALRAIARVTGVSVTVPPSAAARTLTLALAGRPVEDVFRRVLAALDLGGMALVYGPLGRVVRVIVVEAGRRASPAPPRGVPVRTRR